MEVKTNFRQSVSLEVVRASPLIKKNDYLKVVVKCKFCGNDRSWVIRCESCGRTEQNLLEGE
jgi:hypothetical protein